MEKDLASRDKLIEVAVPLFAIKGYAAVSIREIAAAAGINSALISYHFGGKSGLYTAVLEKEFTRVRIMIDELKQSGMGPRECLRIYAERLGRLHSTSPYLLRLVTSELTTPTACFETVIKKRVSAIAEFLMGVIEEGMKIGEFRRDLDAGNIARALAGMINFYFISTPIVRGFMPDSENRTESYITQALAIFMEGLEQRTQ